MTSTTWTLHGVDGTALDLAGCNVEPVLLGTSPGGVFGLPPVQTSSRPSPTRAAGAPRPTHRYGPRLVVLDLVFMAPDASSLVQSISLVSALLDPQGGDCRLVYASPDGESFDLPLTYSSGLQPTRSYESAKSARARCTFRCYESPFYRGLSETEQAISFPVTGSGTVVTDWDADLDWDAIGLDWDGFDAGADGSTIATPSVSCTARAWPLWEFTGPLTRVEVHNATTGLSFDWSGVVAAGEVLSVGMSEDDRHVRVDGVDRWLGLSDESRMWWLEPGRPGNPQTNTILIKVTGADSNTTATMTYQPLWLTPPS